MANKQGKHPFEEVPPQQEKYSRGDDGWDLKTTACPLDTPKVNPNNANVAANLADTNEMRPVYNDRESYAIRDSQTNGRKG